MVLGRDRVWGAGRGGKEGGSSVWPIVVTGDGESHARVTFWPHTPFQRMGTMLARHGMPVAQCMFYATRLAQPLHTAPSVPKLSTTLCGPSIEMMGTRPHVYGAAREGHNTMAKHKIYPVR